MLLNNFHIPVMLEEVKTFIPSSKKINVIDATFGGGGYSRALLENYDIKKLIAIDRDPISKIFATDLQKKYKNFDLINGKFSEIDNLVSSSSDKKLNNFDIIIFDLGLSSNQLEHAERVFSFNKDGPLNMNMGSSDTNASEIINSLSETELANIFFKYGNEKFSKRIARNIVKSRKINLIKTTKELTKIINDSIPSFISNKSKINPATKTFQALRIYVNDELKELELALSKITKLLKKKGKLIIVSFQSLEDRIVKDFLNHNSGKRRRSSRHYPELADEGPITFKLITKKPIRPQEQEIYLNARSRSAKLRVGQKII